MEPFFILIVVITQIYICEEVHRTVHQKIKLKGMYINFQVIFKNKTYM